MRNTNAQLTFGITGLEGKFDNISTASDLTVKVNVPAAFKLSDIRRMTRSHPKTG